MQSRQRSYGPMALVVLLFAAAGVNGCGSEGGGSGATGGAPGSGGSSATGGTATGGESATGGKATGGQSATGGMPGTGGVVGTGGSALATGGSGGSPPATGGSGGHPATGGAGGHPATGGSGGHPGTGGAGGMSNGGSNGNCTPIDPNAIPQARNLLCYLNSINGSKVLSGQQETSWSNPQGDIDYYVTTTGKHPAILGGDYLYPDGTTTRAQAYWQAGGITMMRYHMGAPPLSDTYDNSKMSVATFDDLTKAGTSENTSLNAKLDYLAGELMKLQTANVPVIMVLYHEVDSGAWFWWSKGTGPQFVTLWKYTINYINTTKGVHNVLWTLGFGHDGALSAYNPGKGYYDLGGIDEYDDPSLEPYTTQWNSAKGVFGAAGPIPLHETGAIPQPADMFANSKAPWVLWNVWATYENTAQSGVTYNTAATIMKAYSDAHTVTRETLPSLE
jgi:Glycosyl hydrolase family 26